MFSLGILFQSAAGLASPARDVRQGNALYEKGDYDASLKEYQEALDKDPESDVINFDAGTAYYKKEEYKKSKRYGTPLSCILVDIDNFDKILEKHGKNGTNEILVEVASMLLCESRDIDIVGRIEDSKFLILLPNTGLEGSRVMADRLNALIPRISRASRAEFRSRSTGMPLSAAS